MLPLVFARGVLSNAVVSATLLQRLVGAASLLWLDGGLRQPQGQMRPRDSSIRDPTMLVVTVPAPTCP